MLTKKVGIGKGKTMVTTVKTFTIKSNDDLITRHAKIAFNKLQLVRDHGQYSGNAMIEAMESIEAIIGLREENRGTETIGG